MFFDIGGIVDHHCLNFLFIIFIGNLPYYEVRKISVTVKKKKDLKML